MLKWHDTSNTNMPLFLDISKVKMGAYSANIVSIGGNPNATNLAGLNQEVKKLLRTTKSEVNLILDCQKLNTPSRGFFNCVESWNEKLRKKNHRIFIAGTKMRNPQIPCFSNLQQAKAVCFKSVLATG